MFPNLKASLAPFILRIGLAGIFLYHGALKVVFEGGRAWHANLPPWLQMVIAWGELIGGLALAIGLLSRVSALFFTIEQIGAILIISGVHDFVQMRKVIGHDVDLGEYRWGVGYEYNFAIITMCLALLVLGSGHWSLDWLMFHGSKKGATEAGGAPAVAAGVPVGAAGAGTAPS